LTKYTCYTRLGKNRTNRRRGAKK